MIYASTKLRESSGTKVFVDSSGRRKKILMMSGIAAATGALIYIGVIVSTFVQSESTDLPTRATVSATPR
ncbi:hypothetical protein ACTI_33820 [Actinoplanes sp. OR16]|uniref:hypothetical protein n=1 Tax=Actinoplanes sp. OR16 TaxID=946334 RepID=UPI000F6E1712|nr:hypothetical protein [Actinoplanes sp. OR16]BBH66697.1 hypothetical protein ACTI_33820 [Actinoplanes sp. OR16]